MWRRVFHRLRARIRLRRAAAARREWLVPRSRRRPTPSHPPKIDVAGVGHQFGPIGRRVVALANVDIEVHAGEFVCLLGPSGCGKSTLLYALAGHLVPSGGRISIDGLEVKGPGPDRLLLFQSPALFPWLSVRQNLVFALRAQKIPRGEATARAQRFLDLVRLSGFEDALPHELSGGMRQRVQLARALALDPAVLLMDEPFAALDAQTRSRMHQLLQEIWLRERKTVVFVTHDVREALVLGDRVVVMAARPGRVLQDLEIRLPRPRDPDDPRLVELSRQIREELRDARTEDAAAPRPPRRTAMDIAPRIQQLTLPVALILAWELLARFATSTPWLFPPPSTVAVTGVELLADGRLVHAAARSLRRLAQGYVVSALVGVPLGVMLARSAFVRRGLRPIVLGLQALPSICWLPLAILWFGLSELAILFVVLMGSVLAIAIATEDGVLTIDPILLRAAGTLGIRGPRFHLGVILPAALPGILTGLKLGWSFAWRALLAGELLFASGGLGQLLAAGREILDASQVMAVMVSIILIGVAVDQVLFRLLETRVRRRWGLQEAM